jgi:hypothetical protein
MATNPFLFQFNHLAPKFSNGTITQSGNTVATQNNGNFNTQMQNATLNYADGTSTTINNSTGATSSINNGNFYGGIFYSTAQVGSSKTISSYQNYYISYPSAPITYNSGTISQTSTNVTGSGTNFLNSMIDGTIIYDDGTSLYIGAVSSTTSLSTYSVYSKTVDAGSNYTIASGFGVYGIYSTSLIDTGTRSNILNFRNYHSWNNSTNPTNFFTIPGAITYSYPVYFGIYHADFCNTLGVYLGSPANSNFKINANKFGANQKIEIDASAQSSYTIMDNPSPTGDPLFSTSGLNVDFVISGGNLSFGGTTRYYTTGGNVWTQACRMQLKIDNTSNNANILSSQGYTITYNWIET